MRCTSPLDLSLDLRSNGPVERDFIEIHEIQEFHAIPMISHVNTSISCKHSCRLNTRNQSS